MFTNQAIIKKNTSKIREYLKALGYIMPNSFDYKSMKGLRTYGKIVLSYTGESFEYENTIDCDNNIKLFSSIVALRDDTDIGQIFIYDTIGYDSSVPEIKFFICDKNNVEDMVDKEKLKYCHKATVEELKEYFAKS